jgi:AraC-like DNA-binding protein
MRTAVANWAGRLAGDKGHYFRRSLILIFIVSGIPGLIIGALVYGVAVERVESELLQNHYRQIEHRSGNIDDQLNNIELLLSHWAFDNKFNYSLNGFDFVKNFQTTQDITRTLVAMQGSNAAVKQAELYVGGQHPVLFRPEYSRVEEQGISEVYEKLVQGRNITYWTEMAFDYEKPDSKDLALIHHIPGGSLEPFGVLIFRFDIQKVASMLQTLTPYNEGETVLWQNEGEFFVTANGSASNTPFVRALRERIAASSAQEGLFFMDWEGATYTVSYGRMSRIADEWTYVSASPISSITSPVVDLSKLIITISLVALLLAALLAWLASYRIYSPVRRLVSLLGGSPSTGKGEDEFSIIERRWQTLHQESLQLSTKLAEQLPHVKDSFLHQLLQGYLYAYSEEDLARRMEQFKWKTNEAQYVVVYVRLLGMTSVEGRFRDGDEGLVTFAAVNLIEELASQFFEQSDTVNFHDLSAGIFLVVPNDRSYSEDLQAFCDELTHSINRMLKMRVTIAVSKPVSRITDVPDAYENAKQAVSYRVFDNVNQIIDIERNHLDQGEETELQYPWALERELTQALRTGREEDAREALQAFLEALSSNDAKEIDVQQGMLHLLGSVQHAILASGMNPNRLFKGANMYEELSQIREPKRILQWFQDKIVGPFLCEMHNRSDTQVKRMIEQVMIFLQENYMKDISLDQCADQIGTNPFFLSKTFKQVTGKNFIDYLTELRMDKARELLRDSELRIHDVAYQVGYQHSYFNRIFKKLEGMTPTRYRELSRHSS